MKKVKRRQEVADNKKIYEKCLGVKISDRTWQRDKALMKKSNLLITKDNLVMFAVVKNQAKKFSLPIEQTIEYFLNFQANQQLKGIDIYFKIISFTPCKPHHSTIYRWFPQGYQLERIYKPDEISEILLHAFIYKLRIDRNGTRKKANRSRQISA